MALYVAVCSKTLTEPVVRGSVTRLVAYRKIADPWGRGLLSRPDPRD